MSYVCLLIVKGMDVTNSYSEICFLKSTHHIILRNLQGLIKYAFLFQDVVQHSSIRDRFYAFVGLSERNDRALDIGFGSPGYVLELARAFRSVSCIVS